MALELLIIADDLTGAADTAVQFSRRGISTAVYLQAEVDFNKSPAVAAVTTESRHCSGKEAYRRVKSVIEKALRAGCRRFYKKIDSTFRGNVGSELDALMTAAGVQRLALVPAYPSAGRTTRGGVQYVNGTPLHRSAFARDPREPAAESYIPAVLGKQTSRAVRLAGAGEEAGDGITVYDAETDEDLCAIAAELDKSGNRDIVAGAAGFAEVLAGCFCAGKVRENYRKQRRSVPRRAPLFVVNGSLNEVSLAQVEQAELAGVPCFFVPSVDAQERLKVSIIRELNESGCAVLTTKAPGSAGALSSVFAENIGRFAAAVIRAAPRAATAVFGGDTASAVCAGLGCSALYPRDEIMPGLTVCSAGSLSGALMVLKSGGFGSGEVISRIREYLKSG